MKISKITFHTHIFSKVCVHYLELKAMLEFPKRLGNFCNLLGASLKDHKNKVAFKTKDY